MSRCATASHPAEVSRMAAIDPFLLVAASTKRSSLGRLHVHMSSDAAAAHGPCMPGIAGVRAR